MLKALFKKQLMEVNTWLIQDKKKGTKRGKQGITLLLLVYAALFIGMGAAFFLVANMLCEPLVLARLDWLYFAIMGLMSVLLGVFGSVFNTYATLYMAKDNEFLLSMPVHPSAILFVRLFGVWMWSLIYEAIVFIPSVIAYWIVLYTIFPSGSLTVSVILCDILLFLVLSVFILALACILGWVVARISVKLKNKSIATVIASLLFITLYYWGYSRAYAALQSILTHAQSLGDTVKGKIFPVYLMGMTGTGDLLSSVLFTLMVGACFAVIWLVLDLSFLNMATANRGAARKAYRQAPAKVRTVSGAMLVKETRRFVSSATYMLNCGLGTILMPALGIFLLIKASWVREFLVSYPEEGPAFAILLACAGLCTMSSMNVITAPSVSMEGKQLWLAQSLPVLPWQALAAKLKLHLVITELPLLFCEICAAIVIRPRFFDAVLLLVLPLVFVWMSACFGLAVNLKSPNLHWTDETIPVKQSMGVLLSMLGGWLLVMGLALLYFALRKFLSAQMYLLLCVVFISAVSAALLLWLKTRGTKLFAALS